MAELSTELITDAEECAVRVVKSIEKLITSIRSIPEFSLSHKKPVDLRHLDLYACLEDQSIICHINETLQFVQSRIGGEFIHKETVNEFREDRRSRIVWNVCVPLLDLLAHCYRILDQITEPKPTQQSKATKAQMKPPPPRGMLSIQNYTDIAALIEFVVCTSILPNLVPNVLTSVRDRAQYLLPKSLAGRLSRISLIWGSAVERKHTTLSASLSELCTTSITVSRLLLLDRFRPMLLPRHIADMYAAFFQIEQLHQQLPQEHFINEKYEELHQFLLPSNEHTHQPVIDQLTQARAFQTLLLQGTKGPKWLRGRVSALLTTLATQNLSSIVQVFVRSASSSQDDMTSAALRLAKALSTIPNQNHKYYTTLCRSLVQLLDVKLSETPCLDPLDAAGILTTWSVLDSLTHEQFKSCFLPLLLEDFFPLESSDSVHRSIRRLMALLSVVPKTTKRDRLCELFLSAHSRSGCSLLSMMIRVASIQTIEITPIKSDSLSCLHQICSILDEGMVGKTTTSDVLSFALLYAVIPTEWDREMKFELALPREYEADNFFIPIKISNTTSDETGLIEDMQKRVHIIMYDLLQLRGSGGDELNNIYQKLFHLLLILHFAPLPVETHPLDLSTLRLAATMMLPVLVEAIPTESILLGKKSDSTGILSTIKLFLESVNNTPEATANSRGSPKIADQLQYSNLLLSSMLKFDACCSHVTGELDESTWTKESLFSTTSVVMSILVAMLELGNIKRNRKEQSLLDSIALSLESLATISSSNLQEDGDMTRLRSEMAEMASHAFALIRSSESRTNTNDKTTTGKSFNLLVHESEMDLKSDQPPIRARGIVRLRHLARGFLLARGETTPSRAFVVEVSDLDAISEMKALRAILRVSFLALHDEESYVFLSAIQTVVAAADVCPTEVIHMVAWSISSGESLTQTKIDSTKKLSSVQRIKLVEALVFIIRRRGRIVDQHSSTVLNMMLFGSRKRLREDNLKEQTQVVQQQRHSFFLSDRSGTNELTSVDDLFTQKQVRVATGGPVFSIEEDDLVRAGCISIVVELITAAQPRSLIEYTPALVHLVTHILLLSSSQPIRRTGALLGSTLYNCALREFDAAFSTAPEEFLGATTTFITTLVASNEELMHNALQQTFQRSGDDKYDPATNARCEEALRARMELDERNIISLARMYVDKSSKADEDAMNSLVKLHMAD